MTQSLSSKAETRFDKVLSFTLPDRDSRGRVVRLGPVLEEILRPHNYPAPLKKVLAEAVVLTALMASLMKNQGDQLTMQARSENGPIKLLVCDYQEGSLRGYIESAEDCLISDGQGTALETLFADGHLAITFDVAEPKQRYQGIVPLEGASLAGAVEHYFVQSEQVPTLVRTAIDLDSQPATAGGFLAQHLPHGEQGRERLHVRQDNPEWEHVAILSDTLQPSELLDEALPLESLVWRLFNEEDQVIVSQGNSLKKGCRCSVVHYENVLAKFSKEERREMVDDRGLILVDCAFCSKVFEIQD